MFEFLKRKPKELCPDEVYQLVREYNRLIDAKDEDGFVKFGFGNFENLPEAMRKRFLLTAYRVMRESVGQEYAEQMVVDRLASFSPEVKSEIEGEIWGGFVELEATFRKTGKRAWKTGREDRPNEKARKRK
jgi:hypothetical protein